MGLGTLFQLIYELVHWCVQWCVPAVCMIEHTDRAVKVTAGKVEELGPGYHWWHRRASKVYFTNVMRQTSALDDQLLTTKDGKTVRVGGMLVYQIVDITKYLVENEDADDGAEEMAAHALREVVIGSTFAEMQEPRTRKRDELTKSAQEMLSEFGLRVHYLRLTTFAETTARDLNHTGLGGYVPGSDDDEDE